MKMNGTEEHRNLVVGTYYMHLIVLLSYVVIGSFMNIQSIVVILSNRCLWKKTLYISILWMCCMDLIVVLILFMRVLDHTLHDLFRYHGFSTIRSIDNFLCKTFHPLKMGSFIASALLLAMATLIRTFPFCTCRNGRGIRWKYKRSTYHIVCGVVVLFAYAISFSHSSMRKIFKSKELVKYKSKKIFRIVKECRLYAKYHKTYHYLMIMNEIFYYFLPLAIMIIGTIIILRKVYQTKLIRNDNEINCSNTVNNNNNNNGIHINKRRQRTVFVLPILCITFFILQTPLVIYILFVEDHISSSIVRNFCVSVVRVLYYARHFLNTVSLLIMSTDFRQCTKKLYRL
ncbi:hypothetical protein SNEBB_002574 [Seison nebaliae]|nr:hypothetical protein SNEBB_002574 [Seison nebaliae]